MVANVLSIASARTTAARTIVMASLAQCCLGLRGQSTHLSLEEQLALSLVAEEMRKCLVVLHRCAAEQRDESATTCPACGQPSDMEGLCAACDYAERHDSPDRDEEPHDPTPAEAHYPEVSR